MKEIISISLVQLPYNIEIAAKKALEQYLAAIKVALGADDDTMREIEARVVELLADRGLDGEKVITVDDVDVVKQQMGSPHDFADDDIEHDGGDDTGLPVKKRLMRDEANAIVGGVCAGIAAYFGYSIVAVRWAWAVLAVVTSGVALLAYAIAWTIIALAHTAAERLQMRGKAITLEALQEENATTVGASEISKTITTFARRTTGLVFFCVSILGLVGVVGMVWGHFVYSPAGDFRAESAVSFGSVMLQQLLFVVMCVVVGIMLMSRKHRVAMLITGSVVALLRMVLFAATVSTGTVEIGSTNQPSYSIFEVMGCLS